MTRNQKIALGCGGAGCLGLIVVVVAGCLLWFFYYRSTRDRYDRYANVPSNRRVTVDVNDNENSNDSTSSSSSSSSSDSSGEYSDDEKHRLFHASSITGDYELQRRVWTKIGILNEDFSQGDKFTEFGTEHGAWVLQNYRWVASIDTPEKGRAYVNEHLH